jgi:hypothetical protein
VKGSVVLSSFTE